MARILYWNIQTFAFNKIADPTAPAQAMRRLLKILSNLGVNIPDIFVVVEVCTGGGPIGSPVVGAGANGSMELLSQIRAAIPGNWFLVPPLISGTGGFAEGIAVYYNANTVTFTGPNVLRATAGGPVSVSPPIPGMVAPAVYGAPWVGYVPAGGGGAINALPAGNNFAGKVRFTATPPVGALAGVTGRPLTFPNLNNRSPYLTTFTEVGGAMRNISVIAFHSSPALAVVGTAFMLGMDEMITPPVGNQVQVMVGDFNVPLGAALAPAVYPPFAAVGFTQHFSLGGAPAAHLATHMLPWGGSSPVGVYPVYGYMNPWESLDNVFTRYGAPGGAALGTAILAGSVAAVGAIPPVPGPIAAIAGGVGMGGTTATIAIAAAQEVAAADPVAAAAVITQLSLIPALAALTVPAAVVQAAADAIDDLGGVVPGAVTAALLAGGPVALPVAAAAAATAAFERAGAEVVDITNAVSASLLAAALGGTAIAAGTAAAAAASAAAASAVMKGITAAAAVAGIGGGPNTTVANAVPLIKAAAGSGMAGLAAAVPATGAIAAIGAAGPATLGGAVPANAMIVNQVTGAPYGPAGPPMAPVYPSTLLNPALLGMGGIGNLASFRGWNNYRAVRSTSDHIALVIDV